MKASVFFLLLLSTLSDSKCFDWLVHSLNELDPFHNSIINHKQLNEWIIHIIITWIVHTHDDLTEIGVNFFPSQTIKFFPSTWNCQPKIWKNFLTSLPMERNEDIFCVHFLFKTMWNKFPQLRKELPTISCWACNCILVCRFTASVN